MSCQDVNSRRPVSGRFSEGSAERWPTRAWPSTVRLPELVEGWQEAGWTAGMLAEGQYGMSMDCGEQALLPAVRQVDPDTPVVADGFSGKTPIADAGTRRRALHVAEVMQRLATGSRARPRPRP